MVCSTCHNPHSQAEDGGPFMRVDNAGSGLCRACHDDRYMGTLAQSSSNVGTHPVGILYATPNAILVDSPDLPFTDPGTPGDSSDDTMECLSCHGIHYMDSDTDGDPGNLGVGDGYLLRKKRNVTLCATCHTYPNHNGMDCLDCHDVHQTDSSNVYMVKKNILGTDITFVDRDDDDNKTDFIKSNHLSPSYDGVCQVCHTSTDHHWNNSGGDHSHYNIFSCTSCHTHDSGFAPSVGSCKNCHDSAQGGRREVLSEFSMTTAHAGSGITDGDCVVCHQTNQHMGGNVRFFNADDSNETYQIDLSATVADAPKLEPFYLD